MVIGGELVAQRTEMITIQTTRRLGRDVKIRRSQTEGGNSVHRPSRSCVLRPSITDAKKKATPSHKALLQFSDKKNWPVQYPVPEG
ncbi:hypothetical protein N7489_006656 [Penicillium chrysogenum]|uniref:Uncharacterized protein n=1 Tax=Penicillium chrysogenum TaxID=5076 RepID=A0ABQ8W456_PENCH|nr:uncharacterized protein N7489_006656 [Penicillium chrysogenum]KAJ5236565.1 hypothetical protein N7489_006656 [Penicillium chrysogenum]KAJ5255469.1 hypothetical protein N7505_010620 [Penicillium chrysogenum]KAJ5276507.1 hypothetical protein N7524_002660 [Penicillium chrysogenum]KAJ6152725.1 hypothetical protein N7497_007044 [Penicillium chrysogenum]